jgi:hypothetical protein
MEHLTVKAVATATDLGWFTAIAAVFGNVDRDGDRIVKGAFAQSIEAWQRTGRTVPLHWNHSPDPDDIVGHVVPGSMVETDRVSSSKASSTSRAASGPARPGGR